MAIRISGMNSGLDTEAIVEQLVSAYSVKKDKYVKAQTKLSWKQDAWKSLNSKIYSFYKQVGNFRFSSAYTLKSVTMSAQGKATISAASSAMNGTQTLEIKQVAKSGYLTGAKLKSGVTAKSTMADLGLTDDATISVKVGSAVKNIKLKADTKISDVVDSLNKAGVNANFDAKNGRMFIAAKSTGTASDFALTAGDANGLQALQALGLNAKASSADTAAYEEFAAYAKGLDASGNVVDLFQKDSDGKLMKDADGNYLMNSGVTYDEATTKSYIEDVRKNIEDNTAKVIDLNKALAYASAYQNVSDVRKTFEASSEAGQWDTFTKLLSMQDAGSVYVDKDGNTYDASGVKKNDDGSYTYTYTDDDGNEQTKTFASGELTHGAIRLAELETAAGLAKKTVTESGAPTYTVDSDKVNQLKNSLSTVEAYEKAAADGDADVAGYINDIQTAVADGTLSELQKTYREEIKDKNAYNDQYLTISNFVDSEDYLAGKVSAAVEALTNPSYSTGANKVNGQDAVILLNGAEFTSSTNELEVNGLTITALGETDGEMTVTVDNDVSGLYDKIKGFIKSYNELINEMTSLYNAASSKGYEPLTDDEKDAMTDKEIEKWEEKIKDSLLRRDETLSSVINTMTNAMAKQFSIGGKNYSLSTFGISTLGYMNASVNEQNAYHIAGDKDDETSSSKADKLMAALKEDPDSVVEFMQKLTTGLYDAVDKKMRSSSMKSIYNVYNDKEMASEYSDYTDIIKKWEDKLSAMEDSYYKKFASMETALAKLNSQQSAMGNLFS